MRKLAGTIFFMGILALPGVAKAAFFDDSGSKWWMNNNNWEVFTQMDPGGRIEMTDTGNNLVLGNAPGWNSGWSDGYLGDRGYVSKWGLSLNADFEATVDYHVGYHGGNWAGLAFAVAYSLPGDGSPRWAATSIGWDGRWNDLEHYRFYYLDFETRNGFLGTDSDETHIFNNLVNGFLKAKYEAGTDTFMLEAFRYNVAGNEPVGSFTLTNLKTNLNSTGVNSLRIGLLGGTGGADFSDGENYFTNFSVNKGTITPEPASMLLFGLGGVSLVFFRKLKRRKVA